MQILVLIKQVPLPKAMRTTKEGLMDRTGAPSIINPYCKRALEMALQVKEKTKGTVTVLSMGPPSFEQSLREALAMGADDAYLLTDRRLAGSDTWATARALELTIRKIQEEKGPFDLIFAGIQTIDGDTGHVGPQVAERLGIHQVTYVTEVNPLEHRIRAKRIVEKGYQIVEAPYPVLMTVRKDANVPRGASLRHAIRARKYQIRWFSIDDIGLSASEAGLTGSPTIVSRVKNVTVERPPCKVAEGETSAEKVANLLGMLDETIGTVSSA